MAQLVEGKMDMLRPLFKAKYDWDIATVDLHTQPGSVPDHHQLLGLRFPF